jgi:hypothetical protein
MQLRRLLVKRIIPVLLLFLAVALPAIAEEISLKDGTKIVGHMTQVTADKIEVETTYGKVQLKRSDILSINFPENGVRANASSESVPAKLDAPKMDESLNGLQYVNRTGKFSLTMAPDWMINTEIHRAPETLAMLSSRDKTRYLMVMQEEYPGSLQSYKELAMLNSRKSLGSFEELSEFSVTIDGKPGVLIFYRGTLSKASNLPVEFVSAITSSGKTFTKITGWCVEPLFRDMQPAFEKMVNSYRSTGGQTTAAAASTKP